MVPARRTQATRPILRHHLVIHHLVLQPHLALPLVRLLELAESLIEVLEDNKDPLDPQAQEVMKAMKAHQDLQDHQDYTAKEAPQGCEETPDLQDHQDLQGQQAQQAPTCQEQTELLVCDMKKNSRHRISLPLMEPRTPMAPGLKRVMPISTMDSNPLLLKT